MTDPVRRTRLGFAFGLSAYFVWGVVPLYFKLLAQVTPTEIVAHRILWSIPFLAPLILLGRRLPGIAAAITAPRLAMTLALTSMLIAINWLVYVYAVVRGHVLEASLGYYLNPLVNVLLGVLVLKERLSLAQKGAVLLAGGAVAFLALRAGGAVWITLALALSFAFYGFLRKVIPVDALEGLAVETLFLAPVALAWILWLQHQAQSAFLHDRTTGLLLVLAGALTAFPLLLFTAAGKRLPYSTLGFLQYLTPSLQFLLAVFAFGEPLDAAHLLCFGAIWLSLILFIGDGVRLGRAAARAEAAAA